MPSTPGGIESSCSRNASIFSIRKSLPPKGVKDESDNDSIRSEWKWDATFRKFNSTFRTYSITSNVNNIDSVTGSIYCRRKFRNHTNFEVTICHTCQRLTAERLVTRTLEYCHDKRCHRWLDNFLQCSHHIFKFSNSDETCWVEEVVLHLLEQWPSLRDVMTNFDCSRDF
ncbi:hypothetical protein Tco_0300990 [Tanacetum coccineum]